MPAQLTLVALKNDYTRRRKVNRIKATPVGAYTTGGAVLDFTALTNPNFQPNVGISGFDIPPLTDVTVTRLPDGYTAEVVAGSDPTALATAYFLKVYSTVGTELAAANWPAGLLADFFQIEVNVSTWTQ